MKNCCYFECIQKEYLYSRVQKRNGNESIVRADSYAQHAFFQFQGPRMEQRQHFNFGLASSIFHKLEMPKLYGLISTPSRDTPLQCNIDNFKVLTIYHPCMVLCRI